MVTDFHSYTQSLAEINCYSQDMASAFQWFRDVHNLYPVVRKRNEMYGNYFYRIVDWNKPTCQTILVDSEPKYGFADARDLALTKLIEIVKNK
jgi:hypothetical protein